MGVQILADVWLLLGLAVHVATIVMSVVSVAVPYWMNGLYSHFGLWSYCYEYESATFTSKCYSVSDVDAITVDGLFRTTQALMCIGCIVTVVEVLLIFALFFMVVRLENRKYALFVTVIVAFIQGVVFFAGCVIFLSQKSSYGDMDTDWAHFLAWASTTTSFITACLLVIHYAMNREIYDDE